MKVLLVYDSLFGNTEKVAKTIAGELSKVATVRLERAASLPRLVMNDYDLLVLGGPTHRQNASEAVQKLLQASAQGALHGLSVATFDTCYEMPRWIRMVSGGTAADKIMRGLRKLGALSATRPKSFLIEHNNEGPLLAGQLEEAERWAASLAKTYTPKPVGQRSQRMKRAL
ncbi:MAG: flavodoxin family protein [Trueperaceae bacterium]|nr:MAG: flavodoxin family protein [Trueperaceae bacterium]